MGPNFWKRASNSSQTKRPKMKYNFGIHGYFWTPRIILIPPIILNFSDNFDSPDDFGLSGWFWFPRWFLASQEGKSSSTSRSIELTELEDVQGHQISELIKQPLHFHQIPQNYLLKDSANFLVQFLVIQKVEVKEGESGLKSWSNSDRRLTSGLLILPVHLKYISNSIEIYF